MRVAQEQRAYSMSSVLLSQTFGNHSLWRICVSHAVIEVVNPDPLTRVMLPRTSCFIEQPSFQILSLRSLHASKMGKSMGRLLSRNIRLDNRPAYNQPPADLGDERIASHDVVRATPVIATVKTSMLAPRLHHSHSFRIRCQYVISCRMASDCYLHVAIDLKSRSWTGAGPCCDCDSLDTRSSACHHPGKQRLSR